MSDYGNVIEATFGRQNIQGRTAAVANIDASPDNAARSLELSRATGISPNIINGDLENFENQHKLSVASEIVNNNSYISDYLSKSPLHSQISNDDYANLDSVSEKMTKLGMKSVFQTALSGFMKGFNAGYDTEGRDAEYGKALTHPLMAPLLTNPVTGPLIRGFDTSMRTLQGALVGVSEAVGDASTQLTGSEAWGRRLQRDVFAGVQVAMPELTHSQPLVNTLAQQHAAAMQVRDLASAWAKAEKTPPPGVHPVFDEIHKVQNDLDLRNLDEALKEAQSSTTRERAPEIFEGFIRQHTDASIGISGEKVAELYGDKVPHPDDGLLGFVPDLPQQLIEARASGGDVQVPLADWLAYVDPQVAKELRDDIRVRPGGVTKAEAKELKTEAKPPYHPEAVKPDEHDIAIEAIREAAGLRAAEPVKDITSLKLEKGTSEDLMGSTFHNFTLHDEGGSTVGYLNIAEIEGGKKLYVEEISGLGPWGANKFGPKLVRGLLEQLKAEFPNAEELMGVRISGARLKADAISEAKIRLDDLASLPEDISFDQSLATRGVQRGGAPIEMKGTSAQPLFTHRLEEILDQVEGQGGKVSDTLTPLLREKMREALHGTEVAVLPRDEVNRLVHLDYPERAEKAADTPAFYHPQSHRIIISDALANGRYGKLFRDRVIMHEAAHAYTEHIILTDKAMNRKIMNLMDEADMAISRAAPELRKKFNYAFQNTSEFMAEAFSNPAFQAALSSTRISEDLAKKLGIHARKPTLWDMFREAVKDVLEQLTGRRFDNTAMDALLKIGEEFEKRQGVYRSAREKMGLRGAEPVQPELPGVTRMEDRDPFDRGAALGMTQVQYEKYLKLIEERQAQDLVKAQERAEKEQRKRLSKEWKEGMVEERPAAVEAVNQRPDVMLDEFFREGKYAGQQLETLPKLNPDHLTPEQQAGLPKTMQSKNGLHPDDIAGIFGFQTGREMVDGLVAYRAQMKEAKLRPEEFKRKLITAELEQRMRAKYGDLEARILDEAKDQVLSETQLEMLHEETLALGLKAGTEYSITKDQMKSWIQDTFSNTRASHVSSDKYLQSAGKAGRMAEAHLLDGDFVEAFREKQKQFISVSLAQEARKFERAQEQLERTMKRFREPVVKAVEQEFTDFIHDLMLKAGYGVKRSLQDIQAGIEHWGNTTLSNFVNSKNADGWTLAVTDEIGNGNVKKIEDMTVQEFREFKDAIDSLNFVGREVKKIEIAGEKREFAEWKKEALANIKSLPKRNSARQGFFWLDAILTRPEEMFKDLDLRKEMGPLYSALIHPFELSKAKSFQMMKDLKNRLKDIQAGSPKWQKTLKDNIPQQLLWDPHDEVFFDLSREQMINIMLNFGNRGNIDKFTRAWGGAREGRILNLDEARVFEQKMWNLFDRYATKEDWDFVQAIWDIFKPWQKEADTLYRNTSGVAPKWIEPAAFKTRHGDYAGGYFPIMYDRLRSHLGTITDRQGGQAGILNQNYFRASTAKGHTKERTGYKDFIDFQSTIDTLGLRMQQMIHDIAFRDFVIQGSKVLYDKEIRAAIRKHYGKEYDEQMIPWLKRVANNFNTDEQALSRLSQLMRRVRINMIGHALPFNYKVLLTPDIGAFNPAATLRFFTNYSENYKLAMEKSKEIPYLIYNMDRDFREQLERTVATRGWTKFQATATEAGYSPVVKLSQQFRMVTFVEKYREALAKGMTEAEASSVADSYVRQRHGSAHVGDLPSIMSSSEGMKVMTMFYGYFNTMYNWQREIPGDLRRGDYKKAMQAFYGTVVIGSMFGALITPGKKDESWFAYISRVLSQQVAGTLPFIRDAVNLVTEGYEARAPISSLIKSWWNVAQDGKRFMIDKKPVKKGVKHATEALGMTFGIPGTAQAGRTGQFAYDVYQGRQRPRNFYEWVRGSLTGEAQPKR